MQLTILSLWVLLFHQTALGIHFPFGMNNDHLIPVSLKPSTAANSFGTLSSGDDSFEINKAISYRSEDGNAENSQALASNSTVQTEENNSTLPSSNQPVSSTNSVSAGPSTSVTENVTATLKNESHSQASTAGTPSIESSAATTGGVNSSVPTTSSNNGTNTTSSTTTDDDEPEGVARGKPTTTESANTTTTEQPKTLYEKSLALIGDPYTLSILIPVAAGIVFATTIMLTIATCRCIRRRCIRRRLRRKALPDSVKNLRPSDRARLLAESSDEEF